MGGSLSLGHDFDMQKKGKVKPRYDQFASPWQAPFEPYLFANVISRRQICVTLKL